MWPGSATLLSPVIGSAARPMFATELSGALAAASGTSAPSTRRNLGITTIALLEGAAALRCGRGALALQAALPAIAITGAVYVFGLNVLH